MSLSIDGVRAAAAKEVRISCTLASWLEHGPGVVAKADVTRVDLTDRTPAPLKGSFIWGRGDPAKGDSWIPAEVFEHKRGILYRTEQDARGVLSEALIAWAKQKAGVKP